MQTARAKGVSVRAGITTKTEINNNKGNNLYLRRTVLCRGYFYSLPHLIVLMVLLGAYLYLWAHGSSEKFRSLIKNTVSICASPETEREESERNREAGAGVGFEASLQERDTEESKG